MNASRSISMLDSTASAQISPTVRSRLSSNQLRQHLKRIEVFGLASLKQNEA
jgi:hypothetical protein